MNANQTKCYNSFVDIIHKNKIELISIHVRTNGNKALHFTIDSNDGFTEKEMNKYFGDYFKLFPGSGISYNLKRDLTPLEEYIFNKSESVLNVGWIPIKLEKINATTEERTDLKTYLMHDTANGFYKIGKSVKPKYREKTLQSEKPTVELLHTINKNIERELHSFFAGKRIRGEWFALEEKDINYIKSL